MNAILFKRGSNHVYKNKLSLRYSPCLNRPKGILMYVNWSEMDFEVYSSGHVSQIYLPYRNFLSRHLSKKKFSTSNFCKLYCYITSHMI